MRLPKFFTIDQIELILDRARHSARDLAILVTFWATGLRASELRQLKKEDFHGDRLFVSHAKGHKQRWVPLSRQAQAAIEVYLDERGVVLPHEGLFVTQHGKVFSRSGLYKLVRSYYEWAGVGVAGPHRLRHSSATFWLNRGVELPSVQKILGHVFPSTTAVYLHLATEAVFSEYHDKVG